MAATELRVETGFLKEHGVAVVRLFGSLDGNTFDLLERELQKQFKAGRHRIVLDLAGVDYISSAGVGVFIGALHEVQERHGNIVLLNPTDDVREVLELLNLTVLMQVVDELRDALALF